jgi:hypothetical protein
VGMFNSDPPLIMVAAVDLRGGRRQRWAAVDCRFVRVSHRCCSRALCGAMVKLRSRGFVLDRAEQLVEPGLPGPFAAWMQDLACEQVHEPSRVWISCVWMLPVPVRRSSPLVRAPDSWVRCAPSRRGEAASYLRGEPTAGR